MKKVKGKEALIAFAEGKTLITGTTKYKLVSIGGMLYSFNALGKETPEMRTWCGVDLNVEYTILDEDVSLNP